MPQRVVTLATQVSDLATEKLRAIEHVSDRTQMLALNARIQAAHAGDRGAAFAVVAEEVGGVAQHVRTLSQGLAGELAPRIAEIDALGRFLVEQVPGQRVADLALNAIELMDRNLYERSCDVRWWATDSAFVDVCATQAGDTAAVAHACKRLGVILSAYTVYLDLWVCDAEGRVIAHGRPDRYPGVLGSSAADAPWFRNAMGTRSGDDYVVDDITVADRLGDAPVATYATAIRAGGETHGSAVGALGIFFDWQPQAHGIVGGLRLSEEERSRTRALLLDAHGLILAASDGQGVLSERVELRTAGRDSGFYSDGAHLVGFARTPGYETYEGLGWYGALIQRRAPQD